MYLLIFLSSILLFSNGHAKPPIQQTLVLAVGESVSIPAKNTASVWVSNGKALKVEDLNSSIRLTARKMGQSSVRIGNQSFQSYVVDVDTYTTWRSLKSKLSTMWGPSLRFDGKRPTVKGQVHRVQDWLALASLSLPSPYNFEAQLDRDLIPAAQIHFKNKLAQLKLPLPRLQWTPKVTCELSSASASTTKQTQQILAHYGIHCESSKPLFELKPLVRTKIVFAEVTKQFQRQLGVDWQQDLEAQILPGPTSTTGGLLTRLNTLEGQGKGQVLASPSLVTRSGFEGTFLAGGELPIQVGHFKSKSVTWKKYGVQLRVKPLVDQHGQLRLNINIEISSIDMGRSIGDVPALKVNSFHTEIDLKKMSTIVISGLLKTQGGLSSQQLPGLHRLPIIGALFRSEMFLNDQSELVAFLTPSIVEPNSEKPRYPEGWKQNENPHAE